MRFVKKMDLFVLRKFLLIFFAAFFVTLFVFMMEFTWQYVDKLIGKGLTLDVMAEFFWHMAVTTVPMSLPLSVLLASLISFGNMGEKLELLAMKAAGISLVRIMAPAGVFAIGLACISFVFQNKWAPEAQLKMRALLYSMQQTSPALEIPEGVFYNGVPGFNLFVERKDVATGKLYGLMVYKTDQGFDKAQIVVADSGRMVMTEDKLHLVLDVWDGEQFENLNASQAGRMGVRDQPSDRETFGYKRFIIDFDSNFDRMDEDLLRGMATTKNLTQLQQTIDSVNAELDSLGREFYGDLMKRMPTTAHTIGKKNVEKGATDSLKTRAGKVGIPQVLKSSPEGEKLEGRLLTALHLARTDVASAKAELEWRGSTTKDEERFVRTHRREWHRKFTYSFACIFFFFIGAPLGAIIRKGGLGMPAVISVIIFLLYYIIDNSSAKMARNGSWNMIYGMWISSAVLAPTGAWLTYKANNDSVVFNIDAYVALLKRFFGFRSARHLMPKEVIIDEPDYTRLCAEVGSLSADMKRYADSQRLYLAPSYIRMFFRSAPDDTVAGLAGRMEAIVEELSNSRDYRELHLLNRLPQMYAKSHTSPFHRHSLNVACGILLPVGLLLWLRAWRFRLRLLADLRQCSKVLSELLGRMSEKVESHADKEELDMTITTTE